MCIYTQIDEFFQLKFRISAGGDILRIAGGDILRISPKKGGCDIIFIFNNYGLPERF
jgi:hypothetical protein